MELKLILKKQFDHNVKPFSLNYKAGKYASYAICKYLKKSKDLNIFLFTVPFPLLRNLTFLFHHASLQRIFP